MTATLLTLAALAVVYALVAWESWWRARLDHSDLDESKPPYHPGGVTAGARVKVWNLQMTEFPAPPPMEVREIALRVRDRLGPAGELEPTFAATLAEVERLVVA